MKYPVPDRSNYKPVFNKRDSEYESVDIGWCEGVFSDGRPYRVECFAESRGTFLNIYFSKIGLENANADSIYDFIVSENLCKWKSGNGKVAINSFIDKSGNEM